MVPENEAVHELGHRSDHFVESQLTDFFFTDSQKNFDSLSTSLFLLEQTKALAWALAQVWPRAQCCKPESEIDS